MVKTVSRQELSCGHENNLLIEYEDGSKNTPGICPKGDQDVEVFREYYVGEVIGNREQKKFKKEQWKKRKDKNKLRLSSS